MSKIAYIFKKYLLISIFLLVALSLVTSYNSLKLIEFPINSIAMLMFVLVFVHMHVLADFAVTVEEGEYRRVVDNVLDYDIVVSKIKLQSSYYVHFRNYTNTLSSQLYVRYYSYCNITDGR